MTQDEIDSIKHGETTEQPLALRLANRLKNHYWGPVDEEAVIEAAAELHRLHAELDAALKDRVALAMEVERLSKPGHVWVPVEPTEEMIEAGRQVKRERLLAAVRATMAGKDPDEIAGQTAGAEYRAMVAAAKIGINSLTEAETAASASVMGLTRKGTP